MSKKLVAYFSASGVTKKVALRLAQEELAELFEICPKIEYTSADLNWMDDNSRSSLEMKAQSCRPEILNKLDNLDQYEIIYLGFQSGGMLNLELLIPFWKVIIFLKNKLYLSLHLEVAVSVML